MIRKIISIILVAVLALSCASGCTQDPVQPNGVAVKQELTLDTAAISSCGELVETENGYYYSGFGGLVYADKSDLTNWVLVCNDPTCEHILSSCSAKTNGGIAMVDDRILSLRSTEDFKSVGKSGLGVYSMAPDGTDLQLEYFVEDTIGVNEGSTHSISGNGQGTFYCGMYILQTDGTYLGRILTATAESSSVIAEATKNDMSPYALSHATNIRGDAVLRTDIYIPTEERGQHFYRISGNNLEDISHIDQYEPSPGYLSGDDLYHYVPGKGYYHTKISTGESQKMLDAQLKDGQGYHFLEHFIVEHNMTFGNIPAKPRLLFNNGEKWVEVEFPEDFEYTEESNLSLRALTTQHIILEVNCPGTNSLYVIDHTDPNPVLTLCGQF